VQELYDVRQGANSIMNMIIVFAEGEVSVLSRHQSGAGYVANRCFLDQRTGGLQNGGLKEQNGGQTIAYIL
jgi:hypothetical protein